MSASLESYVFVIDELEQHMVALEKLTPLPIEIHQSRGFVFRHKQEHKILELAIFMKAVRIVSLLNASLHLLETGFPHAVNILCRAIDESVEDIIFLSLDASSESHEKRKSEFLEEFFQEQFADFDDPLSTIDRKMVGRKDIRASVSSAPVEVHDPSLHQHVSKSIAQVYSGFVHGAYVFIMELFGGSPPHYHTNSMAGTPPAVHCIIEFGNQVYRSIMAINAVARRYGQAEMSDRLNALSKAFDETSNCTGKEGIEQLRRRLNSLPSRRGQKKPC